jgi:hypothetical protein
LGWPSAHLSARGDNLKDARDKLGELRNQNKGRYDWDAQKKQLEERRRRNVTFSQWGRTYFDKNLNPNCDMRPPSSIDREKRSFAHLTEFFGALPLPDISKGKNSGVQKKAAC